MHVNDSFRRKLEFEEHANGGMMVNIHQGNLLCCSRHWSYNLNEFNQLCDAYIMCYTNGFVSKLSLTLGVFVKYLYEQIIFWFNQCRCFIHYILVIVA
jgi:hypothetical protein